MSHFIGIGILGMPRFFIFAYPWFPSRFWYLLFKPDMTMEPLASRCQLALACPLKTGLVIQTVFAAMSSIIFESVF